jgi:uncharacterized protein involved in outer membrane biogenesis
MRRGRTAALLSLAVILAIAATAVARVAWVAGRAERWIGDRLAAELGREVAIGAVDLSFSSGLDLRLRELRVGDDPAFARGDFLVADEARLRVAFLPALLGRYEIDGLTIDGARLHVLWTEQGWNGASLGRRNGGERAAPEPGAPARIGPIEVRDAEITLEDRTEDPPKRLTLREARLSLTDASPSSPIELRATSLPFDSARGVLDVSATIAPRAGETDPVITADFVLGPLTIAEARSLPGISRAIPPGPMPAEPVTVRGRLRAAGTVLAVDGEADLGGARYELRLAVDPASTEVRLDLASRGSAASPAEGDGLRDVKAHASFRYADDPPRLASSIRAGSARLSGFELRELEASLVHSAGATTVESFSFTAFDGRWNGTARIAPEPSRPFQVESSVAGLSLVSLFAGNGGEPPIGGRVDGAFAVAGTGSTRAEIEASLRGDGYLEVTDGTIKAAEVADQILEATVGISGVAGLVPADLRARYPQIFAAEGAPFEHFTAAIEIANGRVRSEELALATPDYAVTGAGSWALGADLEFEGTFVASRALTDDLVRSFGRGASLAGSDGRLSLPIRVAGTLEDLRAALDPSFLSQLVPRD